MIAKISGLNIYPVKSMRGISLEHATLTERGLQFDRNWMVVDNTGAFISQRKMPMMASIRVSLDARFLTLEHDTRQPFHVELNKEPGQKVLATVWDDTCEGFDEGAAVSEWLTQVLGRWNHSELRLVRFAPDFKRAVDPSYMNGESAHTGFADGYPFLITSESSLGALNMRLMAEGCARVPMSRFRPNIVLNGIGAFEEDRTKRLSSKSVGYEMVVRKPCNRCKVVAIDQESGRSDNSKKLLGAIKRLNNYPDLSGAFFGQNATLSAGEGASVSVGDELELS